MQQKTKLRPAPDFQRRIAQAGLTPKDIIERAPVARATYFGWLNPQTQPTRRGGMRHVNTWKIARVYAAAAGVTEDQAFATLFVEIPTEGR